jgi:hypothetical protein
MTERAIGAPAMDGDQGESYPARAMLRYRRSCQTTRASRRRNWPAFAVIALFAIAGGCDETAAPPQAFSSAAWLQAPGSSADWSRVALLRQFAAETNINGLAREEVVRLLGEPGMTNEIFYPGKGFQGRIDFYRLSAKNEDSFRIDYDAADKVSGNSIEARPCFCALCAASTASTEVKADALHSSVLAPAPDGEYATQSFAALAALVGGPGTRSTTEVRIGSQTWAIYSEIWRVANEAHRFFTAAGRAPLRQQQPHDEASVGDYGLIRNWPECLHP